jgi:hypothetical protein
MPVANPTTRNTRGMLALVIVMGVLIVIGSIVVIATIANRMSGSRAEIARPAAAFDAVDLPMPAGCQVVETVATDERLILRLGSGERCNQVLIVDLATGTLLGTLRLMEKAE